MLRYWPGDPPSTLLIIVTCSTLLILPLRFILHTPMTKSLPTVERLNASMEMISAPLGMYVNWSSLEMNLLSKSFHLDLETWHWGTTTQPQGRAQWDIDNSRQKTWTTRWILYFENTQVQYEFSTFLFKVATMSLVVWLPWGAIAALLYTLPCRTISQERCFSQDIWSWEDVDIWPANQG